MINGLLMNVFNIMPLIVTLGTMLFFQGASYIISGGVAIFGLSDSFKFIGQGYLGFVPLPIVILLVIGVLGYIVLHKTYFGRQIYAMGGNPEAARLAGVNIKNIAWRCLLLRVFWQRRLASSWPLVPVRHSLQLVLLTPLTA